jgi:hypothetical protein
MIKSVREKKLDNFLDNYKTQKDWNIEKDDHIQNMIFKYKEYLEDYTIVKDKKDYNNIKVGGYVRFIDCNNNMKWGGILLKKIINNDIDYMIIANTENKKLQVSFYRNTIFYKKHTTASDKTRKLFISYLDAPHTYES